MSGYVTTPNYNLRKPVVGGDNDAWGNDLNFNADTIDTTLKANADANTATKNGLGTMASQNASAVAVTGGSITGQSKLGLASGDSVTFGPLVVGPLIFTDKHYFLGGSWNSDGSWTFTGGITNTPVTLLNPSTQSLLYSLAGAQVLTLVGNVPGIAVVAVDRYGLSGWALATDGRILTSPTISSPIAYAAAEIAARNNAALARAEAVRSRINTTAARPVWKYNHTLWYGQSETLGFIGTPALSTTQPHDNLMLGQATRPLPMQGTTFVPKGDANLHPLVAVNQDGTGASYTVPTGTIQGCTGCTFSAGGMIAITGGTALNSVFAPGDSFYMQGWTPATSNNNDTAFTVSTVTATTIQVTDTTLAVAVTTPQNGIGFWKNGELQYGESYVESALNLWRRLQLDLRGLSADPARLLVASVAGRSGQIIATLAKGASPEFFNQLRDAANAGKAAATAAGGDYGIPVVVFNQGGSDAQGGTTYASYKAAFIQMYTDICADLMPISGQSKQPFYFFYQVSDGTSRITDDMGVARAQYDCMIAPPSPNWYCLGPSYYTTSYAPHQDGNGYRWFGSQIGKILHRVIDRGEGWMPLHPTQITYRGRQILVDFHVPSGPLQAQPCYDGHTATLYADLGFTVLDDSGTLQITAATIVADACVLITVGRNLGSNPKLRYGDDAHLGNGNLCDSDPAVSEANYLYVDGSGQAPAENIAALIGKPQPLWNWCCLFSIPIVAG